jgi:hypothetical protein
MNDAKMIMPRISASLQERVRDLHRECLPRGSGNNSFF